VTSAAHRLAAAVAAAAILLLGALAVSTLATAKGAGRSHCAKRFPPIIDDGFPEPPVRFSKDGTLNTTLGMAKGAATINGRTYTAAETYEGTYPGPTLVLCRGDDVRVDLTNGLQEPTNLHVHGLHVSPRDDHDNIFLHIPPGGSQTYKYKLPLDHDPGAFWYHPHLHEHVSPQIFAGLSGAIIVQGGLDDKLPDVPQRTMMIQSTELCDAGPGPGGPAGAIGHSVPFALTALSASDPQDSGSEPCDVPGQLIAKSLTNERFTPLLINGTINPTVKIRPGEIQRWRIFNANNNRIVVLRLEGQAFQVLAKDGNTLPRMQAARVMRIGPGSRREVLVRGGPADSYRMTALPFAQFPTGGRPDTTSKNGGPTPNQTVLTVVSSGKPARQRFPREQLASPEDLRGKHVDRRRTICFAESNPAVTNPTDSVSPCKSIPDNVFGNQTAFKINGQVFHEDPVDISMKLNSVEEWTLVNSNTEWHTFHIHVNPFQVISTDGRRVGGVEYKDNVEMPPNSRIVIRMRPKDFTGKFVIHCHVTTHEDAGMMAPVEVVKNPAALQRSASVSTRSGITISSSAYGSRAVPSRLAISAGPSAQFAWICKLLGLPVPASHGTAHR
jgi:FtsP/CotA-like multicopper oxidase with cupredoxin domain